MLSQYPYLLSETEAYYIYFVVPCSVASRLSIWPLNEVGRKSLGRCCRHEETTWMPSDEMDSLLSTWPRTTTTYSSLNYCWTTVLKLAVLYVFIHLPLVSCLTIPLALSVFHDPTVDYPTSNQSGFGCELNINHHAGTAYSGYVSIHSWPKRWVSFMIQLLNND